MTENTQQPQRDGTPAPTGADLTIGATSVSDQTVAGYARLWWQRVRGGELGSLPIIVALIVIAIVFGILDDAFLPSATSPTCCSRWRVATLAIGTVFVLLIGEIDLSVAYVSAVGGVVMILIRTDNPGWPWWLAILAAVTVTTVIGLLQSIVITKAGVPSFVVTLAGLLIWSGVVLILMTQVTSTGTIRISDERSWAWPTTSSPTPAGTSWERWWSGSRYPRP